MALLVRVRWRVARRRRGLCDGITCKGEVEGSLERERIV